MAILLTFQLQCQADQECQMLAIPSNSVCEVMQKISRGEGCSSTPDCDDDCRLCESFSLILQNTSCESIHDSARQNWCKQIRQGYDTGQKNSCAREDNETEKQIRYKNFVPLCHLGAFIKDNFHSFQQKKKEIELREQLEKNIMQICSGYLKKFNQSLASSQQQKSDDPHCSQSAQNVENIEIVNTQANQSTNIITALTNSPLLCSSTNQSKALSLLQASSDLLEKLSDSGVSTKEWAIFFLKLAAGIETYQDLLKPNTLYQAGDKLGDLILPCSFRTTSITSSTDASPAKLGPLLLYFDKILLGPLTGPPTSEVSLNHLGQGSFKTVYLSMNYENAKLGVKAVLVHGGTQNSGGFERNSFHPISSPSKKPVQSELSYFSSTIPLDSPSFFGSSSSSLRSSPSSSSFNSSKSSQSIQSSTESISELLQEAKTEFDLIKKSENNPYIAKVDFLFEESDQIALVQPFYPLSLNAVKSELSLKTQETINGIPKVYLQARFAEQAFLGLAQFHEAGYRHRDLKPANLLATFDSHGYPIPQIIDLGLALDTHQKHPKPDLDSESSSFKGDERFKSPEIARASDHEEELNSEQISEIHSSKKYDAWSMGLTLWDLKNTLPKKLKNGNSDPASVTNYTQLKDEFQIDCTHVAQNSLSYDSIICRTLNPDPLQRIDAAEAARLFHDLGESFKKDKMNYKF